MIRFRKRGLALMGTAVLTAATVGVVPATPVSAQPRALAAQSTPFQNASFLTYATGSQAHLDAVQAAGVTLGKIEQAFSAVSVNSGGLSNAITDPDTGALVQPSLPSANAYARGSGLEVGLGLPPATANQLQLSGLAEASAPPIGPVVFKNTTISLPGILTTGLLKGIAGAAYLPTFCPVGQPIAYGEGDAAGVGLLGNTPPVVALSQPVTQTAQSQSRSDLVANSDGTFGLASTVQEHIAPISINLGAAASLEISVGGSGINNPITLSTHADGHGNNVTTLTDTGTLVIDVILAGIRTNVLTVDLTKSLGPSGLVVDATTLPLVGPILSTAGIALKLTVAAPPHPISGFPTGANAISAQFDLLTLDTSLLGIGLAKLRVGHMETGVDLASGAISCTVPVSKVAVPNPVQAGNTFVWTISIPSSAAALADSTCDLINIKATDKISVNQGSPTFTIGAISDGGVYNAGTSTITWANLGAKSTYHPGDPPIQLTIQVNVASGSAAGVLQDTANVTAGLGNCTGGATGAATAIGAVQNALLGGSFTLIAPQITTTGSGGLAATGSGPMLAWVAAGLLLLAEATRRLLRRTRNHS